MMCIAVIELAGCDVRPRSGTVRKRVVELTARPDVDVRLQMSAEVIAVIADVAGQQQACRFDGARADDDDICRDFPSAAVRRHDAHAACPAGTGLEHTRYAQLGRQCEAAARHRSGQHRVLTAATRVRGAGETDAEIVV